MWFVDTSNWNQICHLKWMKQAKELDPMRWFEKVLSILITKQLFITRIYLAYKKN